MAGYPFTRALVTGASSGIGEEITRQLATAGIPVVVVARRKDRLEALAKELPGIEVLVADLVTKEGVAAVVQRVASDTNPIDLVVNNAGFGSQTLLATHDPQRMADELTLNCTSLSLISRAAAATMAPRGRGFILNVSSIAAFNPSAFMAVYSATKAYVLSLSQAMNVELKGAGVHVTALCPGLTATEFQQVAGTGNHHDIFPKKMWTSSALVARVGLEDVARNKPVSVPGTVYKVLDAVTNVTPRRLRRKMFAIGMRANIPKRKK